MLQQLVNGVVLGAIYALIALGYTMVYGVLRLINFAHGDLYMLGAFAAWFLARHVGSTGETFAGWQVALVFGGSMLLCALAGALIERLVYRPLRNSPRLALLITAIGVSMLLEYGGQIVFSPAQRAFPSLVSSALLVNRRTLTITWVDCTIVVAALALMAALQYIVGHTGVGRAMRAVALDRVAASLMGIDTDRIIAFTFALGSALAAAGGMLASLALPSIDPLMGVRVGLTAFVGAVLGGIGNIPGAVVGGFVMGLVETATIALGKSDYREVVVFSILIGVLILRPAGLLGRSAVEKV